jgi:enoyl-CoA hydratase/carnithine racemase
MTNSLLQEQPFAGVVVLRLNRPAVLNALNLELRRELAQAFIKLDQDDSVKVILLAGDKRAFCAGADLTEYVDATPVDIMARRMDLQWCAIAQCKKPVIAVVQGYALGGGCELAMHADIILAGRSAQFGQPEIKIGIMPGGGATQRLTRVVGKFSAMNILLRGEIFSAQVAHEMGLVSELHDDEYVESRALSIAQDLVALPTLALKLIKESVLASMNQPLSAGLEFERLAFQTLFSTQDKHEGMSARLDKRKPFFEGR